MKCIGHVAVLWLLALLVACSSTSPTPTEMEISGGATVSLDQFLFVLPDNPKWFGDRSTYRVKLISVSVHEQTREGIYGLLASSFTLPSLGSDEEFQTWVKRKLAQNVSNDQKVALHEVQPYALKGTRCVRSHMQTVVKETGKHMQASFALMCAHPAQKGIGVYVEYYQDNNGGTVDPNLAANASRLFESITFNSP